MAFIRTKLHNSPLDGGGAHSKRKIENVPSLQPVMTHWREGRIVVIGGRYRGRESVNTCTGCTLRRSHTCSELAWSPAKKEGQVILRKARDPAQVGEGLPSKEPKRTSEGRQATRSRLPGLAGCGSRLCVAKENRTYQSSLPCRSWRDTWRRAIAPDRGELGSRGRGGRAR